MRYTCPSKSRFLVLPAISNSLEFTNFSAGWDKYLTSTLPALFNINLEMLIKATGSLEVIAAFFAATFPRLAKIMIFIWIVAAYLNLSLTANLDDSWVWNLPVSLGVFLAVKLARKLNRRAQNQSLSLDSSPYKA